MIDPNALASALPAGIAYQYHPTVPAWSAQQIAEFQAEHLAESGYVLLLDQPDHVLHLSESGWLLHHSLACRASGEMGDCRWLRAVREEADSGRLWVQGAGDYTVTFDVDEDGNGMVLEER